MMRNATPNADDADRDEQERRDRLREHERIEHGAGERSRGGALPRVLSTAREHEDAVPLRPRRSGPRGDARRPRARGRRPARRRRDTESTSTRRKRRRTRRPTRPRRPRAEKAAAAPERPLEIALEIQKATLENGLVVVLNPDHASPTIAVAVTYDVGSRDDEQSKTGFAHLFEHMMFQGSKKTRRRASTCASSPRTAATSTRR